MREDSGRFCKAASSSIVYFGAPKTDPQKQTRAVFLLPFPRVSLSLDGLVGLEWNGWLGVKIKSRICGFV